MLVARRSLQFTRALALQRLLLTPEIPALRTFATIPARFDDSGAAANEQYTGIRGRPKEQPIESYVRTVRDTWGDNLPEGLLSEEEYAVYQRYYGAPVRMLTPEEIEEELALMDEGEWGDETEQGAVTLESVDGVEIDHEAALGEPEESFKDVEKEAPETQEGDISPEEMQEIREGKVRARSAKEARLYEQLGRDIEISLRLAQEAMGEELYVEEEEEREEDGTVNIRTHPLTQLGRFRTFPATIRAPEVITEPTRKLLSDVNNKHLAEAAEKILGQRLEESPIMTGKYGRNINKIPLDTSHNMSDMESNVHLATILPGYYAQSLGALTELRRRLGRDWILGNQHGEGETGVKNVLDVGTGGAGVLAWRSVVDAEQALRDEEAAEHDPVPAEPTEEAEHDPVPAEPTAEAEAAPAAKAVVVVGSDRLRFRMAKILENTTFIPRLPQVNEDTSLEALQAEQDAEQPVLKQPRKLYDLIIATNTILPINEEHKRKYHIQNLWSLLNPAGGVLLLIEKGNAHGFEAIAGARQNLLTNNISTPEAPFVPLKHADDIDGPQTPKEIGSIVAPCTNHKECPMYINGPGMSRRRDYCSFLQRYERPGYMQRIIGATTRNHEDLQYSYVAVRRGIDVTQTTSASAGPIDPKIEDFDTSVSPPKSPYSMAQLRAHAFTLPRNVFPPMKRDKHVIMDMCTPAGKIERWTVPKSYGKVAYRDARKVKWGDLWALGAKTKILRNLNLGDKKPQKVVKNNNPVVEPVKPGGKKNNPGKNQRERRNAQKEARKAAQAEGGDAVKRIAESLNEVD
jgi:ribosomal protein RSM22 (predicted rRNA methylase)